MNESLPNWQELSLREAIGQMIVVRASGHLFDSQIRYPDWEPKFALLESWIKDLNIGGVILLGASAPELYLRTQQLQKLANIPLLIAADIEEGVGQRFAGATWFPPPMSLGAIARQDLDLARNFAQDLGEITARESIALGINWILAPVADVNNNPDNPVINIRAFGESPELVSDLIVSFIEGTKKYAVLTTAKHFPGHGDTEVDSHLDLPILEHSDERLTSLELLPFKRAIAAGVDSVMTAHLLISAWDKILPVTLSEKILKGQLRQRLGFTGLIVTDALVMAGVAQHTTPEEVAVMAIEAGADILLMPQNPQKTVAAIDAAVRSGRLSQERIQESLVRIWQAKARVAKLSSNLAELASDRATNCVDAILKNSLETGGSLPIVPVGSGGRNLILVDDATNCSETIARHNPAVAIPQQLGYQPELFDSRTLINFSEDSRPTLIQLFLRGNPFQKNLNSFYADWLKKKLKNNSIQAFIIYGSPYTLQSIKQEINLPWIFCYGQMPQAQLSALGTLFDLSSFVNLNKEVFI